MTRSREVEAILKEELYDAWGKMYALDKALLVAQVKARLKNGATLSDVRIIARQVVNVYLSYPKKESK